MPTCSVIIPNYNGEKYLEECLLALKAQTFTDFDIILVDNGSTDQSIKTAKSLVENIRIVELMENTGFSHAVNEGIKASDADYVILLNNDTAVFPDFIEKQVAYISKHEKIFSCSALMIRNDERELADDAGDFYSAFGWAYSDAKDKPFSKFKKMRRVFASCGGAAIYRRAAFELIGMFDESFFAYLEDIDMGYRARLAGYENIYNPKAKVYHIGSASSGSRYNAFKVKISARNSIYLIKRNMPVWQIAINLPFIVAGVCTKFAFFYKKGFGLSYFKGILSGLFNNPKNSEPVIKAGFLKYMEIQWMLFEGMYRRVKR